MDGLLTLISGMKNSYNMIILVHRGLQQVSFYHREKNIELVMVEFHSEVKN